MKLSFFLLLFAATIIISHTTLIQHYDNDNKGAGIGNIFQGKGNQWEGDFNVMKGNLNRVKGNINQIEGDTNKVQGDGNQVKGFGNVVTGTGNIIMSRPSSNFKDDFPIQKKVEEQHKQVQQEHTPTPHQQQKQSQQHQQHRQDKSEAPSSQPQKDKQSSRDKLAKQLTGDYHSQRRKSTEAYNNKLIDTKEMISVKKTAEEKGIVQKIDEKQEEAYNDQSKNDDREYSRRMNSVKADDYV